jgi:predicted ATPase
MTDEPQLFPWPFKAKLSLSDFQLPDYEIGITESITALLGPNGSGKTRALRSVKFELEQAGMAGNDRKVRFLASGRSSPLETFRGSVTGPNSRDNGDAAVGHQSWRQSWWQIESIIGDLLTLEQRPDLKLKVEARLQQLLDRSVELSWTQQGLSVKFLSLTGGAPYAANHEASGVIHLVGLLAAIHNEEIGILIIDEPEISLHPQHQAFLLEEMREAAGDPRSTSKKLIILATHSPSMLPLGSIKELPNLIFFSEIRRRAVQIPPTSPALNSQKLTALMARLTATHRIAMFAERVLLVEGPSDELIASQLARRFGIRLLARNAQILPVTGKGEFVEVAKLFSLMQKQVAILADLDALADDNALVNYFSNTRDGQEAAHARGFESIVNFDGQLRNALAKFIQDHPNEVGAAAATYANWSNNRDDELLRRRLTLARVLNEPSSFETPAAAAAEALCARYRVLLDTLAEVGCFLIDAGAIENLYPGGPLADGKPQGAADVAARFDTTSLQELECRYKIVLGAVHFIAPSKRVDEDLLLRPKLSAALGAVFQTMELDTPDSKLNGAARAVIGVDAGLFELKNVSNTQKRVNVEIRSPLFKRPTFPFEISVDENPNSVVPKKLPGNDGDTSDLTKTTQFGVA